jgi:hypothetical protein
MYTLLVTGDVPGASTYFNPLLQQTIIPCTSGTRPSSPNEGMFVYETDTDKMSFYNGTAWVQTYALDTMPGAVHAGRQAGLPDPGHSRDEHRNGVERQHQP